MLVLRHALTGCVIPFWLPFNTEASNVAFEHYLDTRGPFEEIYLMLLSNGVTAIGLVLIEPLSMQECERLSLEIVPPERVRWQREAA